MTPNRFGQVVPETKQIQLTRQLVVREKAKLKALGKTRRKEIANYYSLSLNTVSLSQDRDGMLVEDTVILNNAGRSVERENFTFYHELVHHLINNNEELLNLIHEAAAPPGEVIERLCNAGAAEFLAPSDEVRSMVYEHGFFTTAIPILCERYIASGLVVAFQMTSCANHECYLVVAEQRLIASSQEQLTLVGVALEKADQWRLCITYTACSPAAEYSVARHTLIPTDHLMMIACAERGRVTGIANIPFRSGTEWAVDCDALYFRGSVYAFFNVTAPFGPGQLQLV